MNKRQLKKKKKKCLIVVPDELNLLSMTSSEREKAYKDYEKFKHKYCYRKKYKNLRGKYISYFFPMGSKLKNYSVNTNYNKGE